MIKSFICSLSVKLKITVLSVLMILLSLTSFTNVNAADIHGVIPRKVEELNRAGLFQKTYNLFDVADHSALNFSETVRNYTLLKLNANLADIIRDQPDYFRLTIPVNNGTKQISVLLYKFNISSNGFTLQTNDGIVHPNVNTVLNYRGAIEGNAESLVAFTFTADEVLGMISDATGNFVIGKIEKNNNNMHVIYNDADLIPLNNYNCATAFSLPEGYNSNPNRNQQNTTAVAKCINWYWEIDNDVYVGKGSLAAVNTYMQGIFNQVSTLDANDGINITLQTLYVWSTTDPYTGPGTSDYLNQFGVTRTSFAGDVANLIGYQGGGGVAYVDGLCRSSVKNKMGYCGISSNYSNVPTYSWTVEVITHEDGHLLGSPHTHDCAWNGNNTRIDNCGPQAGYSSGSCAAGPVPAKGTIMSYCHLLSGVGISFSLGFGQQPRDLILDNINSSSCIVACVTCVSPSQPASLTGSTTVCQGTTQTYTAASVSGATSYAWTLPNGWSGSSTTNTISVTSGATGGNISVVAINSCGTSSARTIAVAIGGSLPPAPVSVTATGGNVKVCPGNTRTYTTPAVSGVNTYNWTVPTGAVINSGQGTRTISVTYNSGFTASGTLSVALANSCGNGTAYTQTIQRNVLAAPYGLSGNFTNLCGQSNVTFAVTQQPNASYNWTLPAGASIVSGQGTNTIVANFSSSAASGNITITGSNDCGVTAVKVKAIKTTPAIPGTISGNTAVCANSTGNAFSIAAVPTATSYTWLSPYGSTINDGTTTSSANTLTTAATSVSLNVAAINANSKVSVKAINGCGVSAATKVSLTLASCRLGDNNSANGKSISIYPNPANDRVTVSFNMTEAALYSIDIIDINGKIVYKESGDANPGVNIKNINVVSLSKGIYMMRLYSVNGEDRFERLAIQ